MHLRKAWVEEKEKFIVFGNGKSWADIEADETTFTSTDLKDLAEDPKKAVVWEQWCGLVQRGRPDTLLLKRLLPMMSAKGAPGPGATRKVWPTSICKTDVSSFTLMPPSPIACVCLVSFMTMSDTARRESK